MAETLGSLCDKLTVIKLKQWHSDAPERLRSLGEQELQLRTEIDDLVVAAVSGAIPIQRLTFAANKVYNRAQNVVPEVEGGIAELISHLARVNCHLWHEVEKGYEIENVPTEQKDGIIKQLAVLNLERNQCIDKIDRHFQRIVEDRLMSQPSDIGSDQ